ncbi:MAG: FMN-binding protein [Deltaproteobacteria bacterium]|jgi:electron transport complex protein RnfG|nr:FMN-binding protein [Deltaproteobacteria bacterium]
MTENVKTNFISQTWLVLLLAICFGALLAGIQITLGPTIEANKINETLEKVPEMVFGAAHAQELADRKQSVDVTPISIGVDKAGKTIRYSVFEAKTEGQLAGWVVKTAGQGYADKIEMLIGFDPQVEKITGLFVLDQKETPGLGNKIVTDAWRSQFLAKSTGQALTAVKGNAKAGNEIDAITGATISSKAVTDIINTAVNDLRKPLIAKAKGK